MRSEATAPVYSEGGKDATYLDVQAMVGISKHMGGYTATDALHRLCHVGEAAEVLEVGCGIGVGPAYIAKRYGCRMVAVDISDEMLTRARQRAEREGVVERVTFQKADVRALPFAADRFGAVLVESVLAFVEDKQEAIRELVRVTRPGGYVGLNETFWTQPVPSHLRGYSFRAGPEIITEGEWRETWGASPLGERTIATYRLDMKQEARDRIRWIGWRSILPAWGRAIKLMVTRPAMRQSLKEQLSTPPELMTLMGYGLFAGRKVS